MLSCSCVILFVLPPLSFPGPRSVMGNRCSLPETEVIHKDDRSGKESEFFSPHSSLSLSFYFPEVISYFGWYQCNQKFTSAFVSEGLFTEPLAFGVYYPGNVCKDRPFLLPCRLLHVPARPPRLSGCPRSPPGTQLRDLLLETCADAFKGAQWLRGQYPSSTVFSRVTF